MKESTIERRIVAEAKTFGWLSLKLVSPGNRGVPDRIFLRDGTAVFVEVKARGKRPTVLQSIWLTRLRSAGFRAEFFDNVEEAVSWLQENT